MISPAKVETLREHKPYRGYSMHSVRCSTGIVTYNAVMGEMPGKRMVLAADVDLCKRAIDERERGADSGR